MAATTVPFLGPRVQQRSLRWEVMEQMVMTHTHKTLGIVMKIFVARLADRAVSLIFEAAFG